MSSHGALTPVQEGSEAEQVAARRQAAAYLRAIAAVRVRLPPSVGREVLRRAVATGAPQAASRCEQCQGRLPPCGRLLPRLRRRAARWAAKGRAEGRGRASAGQTLRLAACERGAAVWTVRCDNCNVVAVNKLCAKRGSSIKHVGKTSQKVSPAEMPQVTAQLMEEKITIVASPETGHVRSAAIKKKKKKRKSLGSSFSKESPVNASIGTPDKQVKNAFNGSSGVNKGYLSFKTPGTPQNKKPTKSNSTPDLGSAKHSKNQLSLLKKSLGVTPLRTFLDSF